MLEFNFLLYYFRSLDFLLRRTEPIAKGNSIKGRKMWRGDYTYKNA